MSKLMTREQYNEYIKNYAGCAFCHYDEDQIILKEFEHWVWIANIAPYVPYHTLIIPKRHFTEFEDQTFKEAGELLSVLHFAKKKLLDLKEVDRVVHFWRFRDENAPVEALKIPHFHLNLMPDKEGSWNPILNPEAYKTDIGVLR